MFHNTPNNAESFFQRGAALFFAILMNAFGSALEILTLYQQRPIVEKQTRYPMYHVSAEALASMLTQRGLQNQMISIFVHLTFFQQLSQQIMPKFPTQRSLYEARERQSKTYSWQAFILSNVFVEICWNSLISVVIFFCYYYPVGLYQNAQYTDEVHLPGALYFLFMLQINALGLYVHEHDHCWHADRRRGSQHSEFFSSRLLWCSVVCWRLQKACPDLGHLEVASLVRTDLNTLLTCTLFAKQMYRTSPFIYLIGGLLSTGLANTPARCADNEFVTFSPPSGVTRGEYMQPYFDQAPGYLQSPEDMQSCGFCSFGDSNVFLSAVGISYDDVWKNFGLMWVYIFVNIAGAVFFFYCLARVPKSKK